MSRFSYGGREWDHRAFAVCMATDAFRIAIGMRPINFSDQEVLAWLAAFAKVEGRAP